MTDQKHIINRQILEFRIPKNADNHALQEAMSQIYREAIVPMIDEYLSAFSSPDVIDRIDRLELDLGRLDPKNLRESFIDQVAQQLNEKLPVVLNQVTLSLEQPPLEVGSGKQLSDGIMSGSAGSGGKFSGTTNQSGISENNPEGNSVGHESNAVAGENNLANRNSRNPANKPGKPAKNRTESDLELLGYYFHTGMFPWWAREESYAQFEKAFTGLLKTAPENLRKLLLNLLPNGNALKRLVYTCDDALLQLVIKTYIPQRVSAVKKIQTEWRKAVSAKKQQSADQLRFHWWHEILQLALTAEIRGTKVYPEKIIQQILPESATNVSSDEAALRLLKKVASLFELTELEKPLNAAIRAVKTAHSSSSDSKESGETSVNNQPNKKTPSNRVKKTEASAGNKLLKTEQTLRELMNELQLKAGSSVENQPNSELQKDYDSFSDSEGVLIRNAGLVLLSPFLGPLFSKTGLVENNEWVDESAAERACVLLNFVVMGDAGKPFEGDLPLIKILCGISPEQPVNLEYKLTENDKVAAEGLLEAAIGYNPRMKNTSIDGFRGTFLFREGIVSTRDGSWLLRVERKPLDILLDTFPWNFRQIRQHWMEHLLNVEW